jgi:Toprim domain-containing protein
MIAPPENAIDVSQAVTRFCNTYPNISEVTVHELMHRDLLRFSEDHWRFSDESNGTTRRIDGRKWKCADNRGADWHKLIGLADVVTNDRKDVILVIEGSKDALAAAEITHRSGILSKVGIVCALGSGYRPLPCELQQLRGRRVVVIGDNDTAGIETTQIVCRALEAAGVDHKVWDWSERREKDLYDFLAAGDQSSFFSFNTFFSSSLSFSQFNGSPIQPFNPSTTETGSGIISITIEQFVAQYVVREKGTGNRKSFDLARAVKTTNPNISMDELHRIHHEWFSASQPLLPIDADESQSFDTFLKQICRVRFTGSSLKAACERARSAPAFIPALDGNAEATKLAALCRELQREAGTRAFICPVNMAQQFLNLRWPSGAHWLLHQLELNGVIECVDRGAPNKKGEKGKATMWRYKLPIDTDKCAA